MKIGLSFIECKKFQENAAQEKEKLFPEISSTLELHQAAHNLIRKVILSYKTLLR